MIPKIIHYCWFGGNPLPKLAKKCIQSWKKYCKGYEIIRWDESNYDLDSAPLYVRQAYEAKKWAFVTDYVRLQVVYEHGGIYMDTDVELIRTPNELLNKHAYFGFEDSSVLNEVMSQPMAPQVYVNTGLGFGAEKGTSILREMMDDYDHIPFILEDGGFDQTSCPVRNTHVFLRHGLVQNNSLQIIHGDICILPSEWLCPFEYWSGDGKITSNTISVHWFSASWMSRDAQKARERRVRKRKHLERMEFVRYLPNRMMLTMLGSQKYEKLKAMFRRG